MKKTLKIGRTDFKRIIENNHYFVDKTMLIFDFFHNANDILLMPRPRRFGKTLNLSMIEYFFDLNQKNQTNLFSEFEIAQQKLFCEQHQNQYPVINLSFKNLKANSWEECFENIKIEISNLYQAHDYLLKSDKLKNIQLKDFNNIINRTASLADYNFSLKNLSTYLFQHFGKEVIILIDEYDTPIIYGFENSRKKENINSENSYYKNIVTFMRVFLGAAFKGNNSLKKGLITGIMRIARESIFSDWNNFNVFSITSPYFADKFGFTEKETLKLLEYFSLNDKYFDVEKWYNGYKFGNIEKIYNPWSIVNYVAYQDEGFKPHWVNTSSDALIKERITEPNIETTLQNLIEGKTISKPINENFVFADLDSDKELIWTLLTYSGYLTLVEEGRFGNYFLKIPNFEVKSVFQNIIINWLTTNVKIRKDLLIATSEALINNKIKDFETGFQQIMGDTVSFFDEKGEPEKVYHFYTLGLLAILSDDYIIKSNRESGKGRYDIMLIPHQKDKFGIVIEIKQVENVKNETNENFRKRINKAIENAHIQINENKYYAELLENKIKPENIIKLPIVFHGKDAFMTSLNSD